MVGSDKDNILALTMSGGSTDISAIRNALAGEVVIRRGEYDGRPSASTFGQIKNFSGQPATRS
jgi:methyl-accepting chemotaxis protein